MPMNLHLKVSFIHLSDFPNVVDFRPILKTFVALLFADVPLRNYSLTHSLIHLVPNVRDNKFKGSRESLLIKKEVDVNSI